MELELSSLGAESPRAQGPNVHQPENCVGIGRDENLNPLVGNPLPLDLS